MTLADEHLEVLRFIGSNGPTADENDLRARFGDRLEPLLSQLGDYVTRQTFTLNETQETAALARMPPAEAVVYSLTEAGRQVIAE